MKKKGLANQSPFSNVMIDGKPVEVKKCKRSVDITFVFDTTGSMGDKIEALLSTCGSLVDDLAKQQLDSHFCIVAFGDLEVVGDTIVATGYTRDTAVFKRMLERIPHNSGGGNEGESSLEAIQKALTNMDHRGRKEAINVFIVITDEPALNQHLAPQLVLELKRREIITFCVACQEPYYLDMAKETGGKWLDISPNTSFESIKEQLLKLSKTMSQVVADVYNPGLGAGSVSTYLKKLSAGETKH